MADIFICYSSNDRQVALKLKEILVNRGWTVFIDQDIGTGKRFHVEIERELEQARAVVVLWSKTSRESDYVLDEATEGQQRGILVPAVIEDIKPPYGFRRIQTANLSGWDGSLQHSELRDRLLSSLSRLFDEDKEPSGQTPGENHAQQKPQQKKRRSVRKTVKSDSKRTTKSKSRGSLDTLPNPGETFHHTLEEGSHGPPMVVIPPGRFLMGSKSGFFNFDEKPQHEVNIEYIFAIGQFPVTFTDYDFYALAERKDLPDDEGWGRKNRPVINVSWEDACGYCGWLSKQTGWEYRLPSEAEWEYVARAGTTTEYWWGDVPGKNLANFDGSGSKWSNQRTSPADAFKANPFGLYDVHGNVWEWCLDKRQSNYEDAPDNGSAWIGGDNDRRVVRGGSWGDSRGSARAACRLRYRPVDRNCGLGFRLCCSSPIIPE